MPSPLLEKISQKNIQVFLETYKIKNEVGDALDFKDHPYLWDIYQDSSPFLAIKKAAQIGFTTTAIIKSFWLAKSKRMDIIYTMPTYGDVHTLVTSKVNRIIEQNPILQEWVDGRDTVEQKRIGESIIYYRGTWSERAALSTSSDLNIHDEVDRSNMPVIEQYYSRLQHSKYGYQWMFSNPSVPDFGVDRYYNQSDQKHYFYACPNCHKQQYLTMNNIMEGPDFDPKQFTGYYFGCTGCKGVLPRYGGQWVARFKNKPISGYWVSLLMVPRISADHIKMLERTKPADYFDNFVLGVAHIGSGNTVQKDVLLRNLTSEINQQDGRIVIGVDPGVDIRYTIGNKDGIFYHGSCKNYDELDRLLQRWDKAIMIIDQGGDIIGSRQLREKYKNRVYLAFYRKPKKDGDLFEFDDDKGVVVIDRNNTIQLLIDEFKDKRIPIYGTIDDWDDYIKHWQHIYRVVEEDSFGKPTYKWVRSDRDDYVHTTVYWRAGMDRFMNGAGAIIDIHNPFGELGYTSNNNKMSLVARQKY